MYAWTVAAFFCMLSSAAGYYTYTNIANPDSDQEVSQFDSSNYYDGTVGFDEIVLARRNLATGVDERGPFVAPSFYSTHGGSDFSALPSGHQQLFKDFYMQVFMDANVPEYHDDIAKRFEGDEVAIYLMKNAKSYPADFCKNKKGCDTANKRMELSTRARSTLEEG